MWLRLLLHGTGVCLWLSISLQLYLGILCSYTINYWLHDIDNNWRWMFATGTVPSVLFFIGLFFIPESPRWLYKAGRKAEALKVLTRVGGEALAKIEIAEIAESLDIDRKPAARGELFRPEWRKVMIVGFFLAILVQISGINTIIDYAPKILLAAGVEIKNALLQTSLLGLINFIFTFIAILFIDKVGRRMLYLMGSMGMAVTLVLLALSFYLKLEGIFTLDLHNAFSCLFLFLHRTGFLDTCLRNISKPDPRQSAGICLFYPVDIQFPCCSAFSSFPGSAGRCNHLSFSSQ